MRVRRWLNSSSSILSDRYHLILFYLLESEQNVRNYACRNIQNIQPGEKTKGDSLLYK
jgi:transposase